MAGASEEGLRTTVFPVTSAAVVIPARIARGKFQGGMTAPTPEGDVLELVLLARIGRQRAAAAESRSISRA